MKLALTLVYLLSAAAPAVAEECDVLAADIVRQEGATLDRRTTMRVLLKRPPLTELAVDCFPRPGLTAGWDGAFPPAAFFDLAVRASRIVTNAPERILRDGAIACHKAALRSESELATVEDRGISFECQSFTRDGGGTSIQIYRLPPKR